MKFPKSSDKDKIEKGFVKMFSIIILSLGAIFIALNIYVAVREHKINQSKEVSNQNLVNSYLNFIDDSEGDIALDNLDIATSTDFEFQILKRPATSTLVLATPSSTSTPEYVPKNPKDRTQFVVFAFDGSRSIQMWKDTIAFTRKMEELKKPVHFTYFINAVYLLDPAHYNTYQAPGQKAGVSNIGFGDSTKDIENRIAQMNDALDAGNEIGSHNAGHFNGIHWSLDEWNGQFDLFNTIVKLKEPIVGFRAPELGVNQEMFQALSSHQFLYDASTVSAYSGGVEYWPAKNQYGIWELPLGILNLKMGVGSSEKTKRVLGMDYTLFVQQTGGHSTAKRGSALWNRLYKQTYDAYMEYFNRNYTSERAPIYMANHFSLWNDGVYWQVMQDVAKEVCGKPKVVCGTYKDVVNYMEGK